MKRRVVGDLAYRPARSRLGVALPHDWSVPPETHSSTVPAVVSITTTTANNTQERRKETPAGMDRRKPPFMRPKSEMERGVSEEHLPIETLVRQNEDLRRRLEDENSNYKRRLETYRQAQQHQAALVSRLQAKVLQYKQRCSELESQLHETPAELSFKSLPTSLDLETALRKLNEEQRKNERLTSLNIRLQKELEESQSSNETLTCDLHKLTNEWEQMREELVMKEEEWREEERAFNDYYTMEHNRLLSVWRDVTAVKRLFSEMKVSTERDLTRLRVGITSTASDVTFSCNNLARSMLHTSQAEVKYQSQQEHEVLQLRTEIAALRAQHDVTNKELREKDDKIQQLLSNIHSLEERCSEAEHSTAQVIKLQEEVEFLQNALRDVAHAVIQDAETRDTDVAPPHIHLTPAGPTPHRSPKRGIRTPTSPAFAEGTISAVQASLHKYQLHIHDLQVKLQATKEQLLVSRKQCEATEEKQASLERKMNDILSQLDGARTHCAQLTAEKDVLHQSLETSRGEKAALDKTRLELSAAIEALTVDYEKLQKTNVRLQRSVDNCEDEKNFLLNEIERMRKDAELRESNLRCEEERCSRLREELLTMREELNKASLAKEMLEQHRLEANAHISQLDKNRGDVELELERAILEKSDVQEALSKMQAICQSLEQDKKRLQLDLKKLNDEKSNLQSQCTDQQNDLASLRKELLQAEQTRLDLESDKVSLLEKVKFLEMEKEKVEMELSQISRERGDLSHQLSAVARNKDSLNEEMIRLKQKLEQANETNARLNRDLEELVKDKEDKQVALECTEKDLQRVQEQLASLRSEKEALEGILFDTQTNLESVETKRSQLEKEAQDLLLRQEALKAQVARLTRDLDTSEKRAHDIKTTLTKQSGTQEAEFQQTVTNLKKQNEDMTNKLIEEREQVRSSLEKKLQQTIIQLTNEKEMEVNQLTHKIESLQQHIDSICEQHEEVLLRTENDKQQALMIAHQDQQALQERLDAMRRELEEERGELDRLRRETTAKIEQDRSTNNQLRDELARLKSRLDECRTKCEEERNHLEGKISEVCKERDSFHRECQETKVQLHLSEDKVESIQNQLHDTSRKLKEVETNCETLRKELTDVRRQLTDTSYEKEKYRSSNKELREHVKRTEGEKREQGRSLEEALQKISSLEDQRSCLEAEKTRLQGIMRDVEQQQMVTSHQLQMVQEQLQQSQTDNAASHAEEEELRTRLNAEIEERERARQEVHRLKKQLGDLDSSLDGARQEISRLRVRGEEVDERWRSREQELLVRLEDFRNRERKLEDQKHNLEVCLADATQQLKELKARFNASEGRVRALDAQLIQLETAKKEVEQKLSSVGSTLRRIAGIQMDGSVTLPYRLLSPSRRWTPAKMQDHGDGRPDGGIVDVDPEVVRKGVRNLMQQVAQIERERDDLKTQLAGAKQQLNEAHDTHTQVDEKLNVALQNLRTVHDEKSNMEAQLSNKTAMLQAQTEALHQKSSECQQLHERVTSLELTVKSLEEEKGQSEDRSEKLKQALHKAEREKQTLQEDLSRVEARATKLELQRLGLEGDLQRLHMALQEKEVQVQKLQERCEIQSRNMAALEERCASLKTTVEQLKAALERAARSEAELQADIQSLQRTLQDTSSASQAAGDKLKQLQKSLSNSENERRVVTERLEAAQQTLSELRRTNQQLGDQVRRYQSELANSEVQRSGLEAQLRLSSWPTEGDSDHHDELAKQLHSLQRERVDLRSKVDMLSDKIRQLESEKQTLQHSASKSYELPERDDNILENLLEQENRELKSRIHKLETQHMEKDSELSRVRAQTTEPKSDTYAELERVRTAQLQAERLLEAREQSHRQQVLRLENQLQLLREQLNQEVKRRQLYVLRSSRAGREMQQLRQALGDSLRTVSQDPSLDAMLLEHETRKLDSTLASTARPPE